jgi:asparagine synthetase B (glutamine-hydrolysing)
MTSEDAQELVHHVLLKSVKERFQTIPEILFHHPGHIDNSSNEGIVHTGSEVAVLFSGGVDSTLLAALIMEALSSDESLYIQSIDLITV